MRCFGRFSESCGKFLSRFKKAKDKGQEGDTISDERSSCLCTTTWYWPDVAKRDLGPLLDNKPEGTFMVRRSSHKNFRYALTYKRGGEIASMRIQYDKDLKLYSLDLNDDSQPKAESLHVLVELLMLRSNICGLTVRREPLGTVAEVPLKLCKPLKRDITLKDHCKRAILQNNSKGDKIEDLDLPSDLKEFLLTPD